MELHKSKHISFAIALIIFSYASLFCEIKNLNIIGGGIVGSMEAYYAYLDAKKNNTSLKVTIYEQYNSTSFTTASNIAASLTFNEILAVIPKGKELVKKLNILFSKPGGIRVDVKGINEALTTQYFKEEALNYSLDEIGHNQRTQDLLALGKMSMDLWKEIYNNADEEFKEILKLSNFNPCCEPTDDNKKLHDGYRIDLIYNIPNVQKQAESMKDEFQSLGYKHCTILTPAQVMAIDPFLKDFCKSHSKNNVWNDDAIAIWRPGGCIDAKVFLPQLHKYLKKNMGTYINIDGKQEDCFQIKFGKKVIGLEFEKDNLGKTVISGLRFEDGEILLNESNSSEYVFCPGEAVGTLKKLGLSEPAYAGFAGASLLLNIDIPQDKLEEYSKFNDYMEVYQKGIILAWQARFRDNKIFIGVAGTKAFYGDQRPTKDQEFAKNRNLLQLNMINDILPEFISLALKYDTRGKTLTEKDLEFLESQKIATRWAGVRAVVYDGFPTLGYVYKQDERVENARCTTHLGSGGVSFSPAAVVVSRSAMNKEIDPFFQRILKFGNSTRNSKTSFCDKR